MSPDVPLVVEYKIADGSDDDSKEMGWLRFYLAPKIEEENADAAAGTEKETQKEE